jgi:AraC-like DNA-binding protein
VEGRVPDRIAVAEFIKVKLKGQEMEKLFCAVIEGDPPPPPAILSPEDYSRIKKALGGAEKRRAFFVLKGGRFVILAGTGFGRQQEKFTALKLKEDIEKTNRELAPTCLSVSAGISRAYPPASLYEAFQDGLDLLEQRSFLGRRSVLYGEELPHAGPGKPEFDHNGDLLPAFVKGDEGEIKEVLDRFWNRLSLMGKDALPLCRQELIRNAQEINHYLLEMNMERSVIDILALTEKLEAFVFMTDIKFFWEDRLKSVLRMLRRLPPQGCSPRMIKALDYIQTHFSEDITAETAAASIHVSPNYFSAMFKKETGLAFKSYVYQSRLSAAAYLLVHSDIPVYEAAEKTGYRDYVYFSRSFKKQYGVSPNEYRSRQKQN